MEEKIKLRDKLVDIALQWQASFVTKVPKASNYLWDKLIWILYYKNYIMQEAWEWNVEDYKMAFENKDRLSPEDYRRGLCLYHC